MHDDDQVGIRIDPAEALGRAAGFALAPAFVAAAALRRGRAFHPRGPVYAAVARPLGPTTLERPAGIERLGERLAGPALVRFSGGLYKSSAHEWPELLGCAVRFRRSGEPSTVTGEDDQDLLFATARSLVTLPFAAFRTDVHDYLDNVYFAIARYELAGLGRVRLSLVPRRGVPHTVGRREEKLDAAVAEHDASLVLQLQLRDGRTFPVVELDLQDRVHVDGDGLHFSPFLAGRGLDPAGFVQGLRWASYAASRVGMRATAPRAQGEKRDRTM